ncbi:MFS transporter [Nocardia vaccinii]|uniref:MFS transporter n=1 Tax=Nocardia vaccinii TaxID=1822 RepID=UPI001C3FE990|nr:MFS transporter [Nocardia vaccinii]
MTSSDPDEKDLTDNTRTPDPAHTELVPPSRSRVGMFTSLRVRNYRYFFLGQVVSNTGTWMQRIAQDWLVLSLTGSAFDVGITTAMQFLPMLLFGLYGGVIADRFRKRRLLILTQAVMGLLAAILAILTLTGAVHVWHVYLLALLLGMVTVVDNPTRQTFVSEMVSRGQLRNAVSLNAANFQTARLIGPAVAGAVIAAVGSGWAFAINALSFAAVIGGLLLMRPAELHVMPRVPREKGQLLEGLRYVRARPELIWPIVLVGFIGTFGFNFPTVLSGFAYNIFHIDAGRYGLLNTALAAGSLVGALLASRRTKTRLRMIVLTAVAFGMLEAVTAFAPEYWVFAAGLTIVGLIGMTFNTSSNSMVQLATEASMRGRVMSLYMMVFTGGSPIGGPIVGWVTERYGPRMGLFACGAVSALAALVVARILSRRSGLRLQVSRRGVAFVPRQLVVVRPDTAPAVVMRGTSCSSAVQAP